MEVRIVPTGPANLASVRAAFHRLGAVVSVIDADNARAAQQIQTARVLVLPGVGAFGAAKAALQHNGMWGALRERFLAGRPTLAICLGLQLLAEGSDEAPGEQGLSILEGRVTAFPQSVRTPHMGWNAVAPASKGLLNHGHAYFANSYRLTEAPRGWKVCWSDHGGRFVAALERGGQMATQFHPELSGPWGEQLLDRWLRMAYGGTLTMDPDHENLVTGQLLARVIPCLDVSAGRVVKGIRFQGLRDAGDPAELARAYDDRGADEIVLLDVGATPEARSTQTTTVEAVRAATSIPLTVGGGIRSVADAQRVIAAGADKVAVNTQAVRDPSLLGSIANRFGRQCTVLAIDAARREGGGWEVVVHSGRERTGKDAVAWAAEGVAMGAGEILLTSWDQDGTRAGYDLELIAAVRNVVNVPVIASGGASGPDDLVAAVRAGADAVLAASIFHDKDISIGSIKEALERQSLPVRR